MRVALGEPLQNISSNLLNKVVSKDIKADLKKYKNAIGSKTPKRSGAHADDMKSPQVRFEGLGDEDEGDVAAVTTGSREVRELLQQLDQAASDKMSLLKMLVIKCDEADSSYKRVQNALNHADI
jgi:hypothetical protein